MAELTMRLKGEQTAAQTFDAVGVQHAGATAGFSMVLWENVARAVMKCVDAVIEFGRAAVAEYMKAERVNKQLALAAGDLTDIYIRQAEALEEQYAVDAEAIKEVETMLLRFGAAPTDVEPTTRAVLDYAAATGTEVVSAAGALVKGIEAGSGSVKSMGLHFQTTGHFSKDLQKAVGQLNGRFAGAGLADANSLAGSMRGMGLAIDNIKEAFGALIDMLDQQLGMLKKLTDTLNTLSKGLPSLGRMVTDGAENLSMGWLELWEREKLRLKDDADARFMSQMTVGRTVEGKRTAEHDVGKVEGPKKQLSAFERYKQFLKHMDDVDEQVDEIRAKELANLRKQISESNDLLGKAEDEQARNQLKAAEQRSKDMQRLMQAMISNKKQEEQKAKDTGDYVGGMIVEAAFLEISRVAFSKASEDQILAHFADSFLTMFGSLIGTVLGSPILGKLFGMAGHAWGQSLVAEADAEEEERKENEFKKKTKAFARRQRHHDGAWVDGTPEARRGPGATVNVEVLNGDTMSAFFRDEDGRGFFSAMRARPQHG